VVRRGELTAGAWERIAPLLPENGRWGKQWKDHRTIGPRLCGGDCHSEFRGNWSRRSSQNPPSTHSGE